MSAADFMSHTYLNCIFCVDRRKDQVSVYRQNGRLDEVALSLANYDSGFNFYASLTTDKAEAIGQALLAAAKASRELAPIESNMGPMQLMVAEALGPIKEMFEGGAS